MVPGKTHPFRVFILLIVVATGLSGWASMPFQGKELSIRAGTISAVKSWSTPARIRVGETAALSSGGPATLSQGGFLVRQGLVLPVGSPGEFDSGGAGTPCVILDGGVFKMWYFAVNGSTWTIGYATSLDGTRWTKHGVVLSPSLPVESNKVAQPEVLKLGNLYSMWYAGYDGASYRILYATSLDGVNWAKKGVVLDLGSPGQPDDYMVWSPTVVLDSGTFRMWYSARSFAVWAANIMYATSPDGVNWTKKGVVLMPGSGSSADNSGVADPVVRKVGTTFQMIYAGQDPSVSWRLFFAHSTDGATWTKDGLALDLLSPAESFQISSPTYFVEPNGNWMVYYSAQGSAFQVFVAIADRTPPMTTIRVIAKPGLSSWYVSHPTVYLNASDDVSGVKSTSYLLNSTSWANYTGPLVLPDGRHVLAYHSVDNSGNWETVQSLNVNVDTLPPASTVHLSGALRANGWYNSTVAVELNSSDSTSGLASLTYQLNAGNWLLYSGPFTLPDGQYVISYKANDSAGNEETPHTTFVRQDTTPPFVEISSPGGRVTHSNVTISWIGNDATSGIDHFEISVDGGPFLSTGTGSSLSIQLADGSHGIRVRAFDSAGNQAVADTHFFVDTNVFSLTGPYAGIPTYLTIAAIAGIALFLFLRRRRKKVSPTDRIP